MVQRPSSRRNIKQEASSLNLLPIMNLFIVIIPMLLSITAAVKIAMLAIDLQAPSGGGNEKSEMEEDLPKRIDLQLFTNRIVIKVQDVDKNITLYAVDSNAVAVNKRFNLYQLDDELRKLKKDNEKQTEIGIMPSDNIDFKTLMLAIDLSKQNGFVTINYKVPSTQYRKIN